MFTRMKNFFVNHRRGIAIGGLMVGGSVLAVRYAQRKLHEYQLDQAKAFLEKTRRTQHFEATERTCNQVITNLAPTLCEEILTLLNTDEILEQLRKNPENKTELWNELKVLSFARLTTLVYASSMLVIALRVQVNLVGGYVYKDNVPDSRGSSSPPNQQQMLLPSDFMQTYLSEIQYFLKEGLAQLARGILEVTRKILQDYKLKKMLTLTDMEQIFWAIQMSVNATPKDPNGHMPEYIFNKNADLAAHSPTIKQLVTETMDVLDSDEVATLAANNVSRGFSIVVDHLAEYLTETASELRGNNGDQGAAGVVNPNSIQMALAKIIPIIIGLTAKSFNMSVAPPNLATSLITMYMLSDKVKMLGVNVYELFST